MRGTSQAPRVLRAVVPAMLVAWVAIVGGCAVGGDEDDLSLGGTVMQLPSPALEGSGEPNLFATDEGRVHLSWFDRLDDGGHALRTASLELGPAGDDGGAGRLAAADGQPEWSEVRTIATGEDFFVNWADFPSVHALSDGSLVAHALVRSGPDTYDYEVHLYWSSDDGRTWRGPVVPHRDDTLSEHGFVSLFPWEDGTLGAVWLDGREFVHSPDDRRMTLRFTTFDPRGAEGTEEEVPDPGSLLGDEILLDGRVCDCCQTSAAVTDEGAVVVYRDRTEAEIRDISIVRHDGEGWSEPAPVHDDGWEIPACPVNGPMVAARGAQVAVAWFTAANDEGRVRVAFSNDGGRTFSSPVRVDDGDPSGRVAVVLEPDGRAVVSWLERIGDGAEVRVRRVSPAGARGAAITVAESSAARASGFPRMVRAGDMLVFAWNDVDATQRVQVSALVPSASR